MARALIEIATPNRLFGPVNRCIYCGRKSFNLTKEHVIAYGLAANSLVLRKASCKKCQDKTHEFETFCLRHMWWQFRTILGIPTRKPKEAPNSFPLVQTRPKSFVDGRIEPQPGAVHDVAVAAYPLYYFAYSFLEPAHWTGRPASADATRPLMLVDKDSMVGRLSHAEGFRGGTANPLTFCKMLAKIAHAYGVAILGWDAFISPFGHWLRGKNSLRHLRWIGSADEPAAAPTTLHEIELRVRSIGENRYAVVRLRLFACMPTPRYEIIIGQLQPDFGKLYLFEQPLHRIEVNTPLPISRLVPSTDISGMTRGEIVHLFKEDLS